jgi:hypothetical protein
MEYYNNITNKFPGGLFKYVSRVSLYDERPFEREFFIQIEKSFPFMRELQIENNKPQKNKLCRTSKDDNQHLSIIKYIHLRELDLGLAHDDYVEQFLIDTEMCLLNNVHLYVEYQSLKEVTQNFKRDATQINCAKVTYLVFDNPSPYPKHFKDYFPLADIH